MATPRDATEEYADLLRRRHVATLRYDASLRRDVLRLLLEVEKDIIGRLAAIDPTDVARRAYKVRRLDELLRQVREAISEHYEGMRAYLAGELGEFAQVEGAWTQGALKAAMEVTTGVALAPKAKLAGLIDDTFITGAPLSEWWSRQEENLMRRFADQMRIGVTQGDTLQKMMQRVRGTRANNFTDGLMQTTRREAATLVRTATAAIGNESRGAIYEANADLFDALVQVSTLDGRTTIICMARDGLRWTMAHEPIDHDLPFQYPPLHPQCRSIMSVIVKGAGPLGGERASMDGPVPRSVSFDEWLKGKSQAFQDDLLGKGKAKLWREQRLSLRDLLDFKGQPLTLAELTDRFGA